MLKKLSVQNYILIEKLEIDFSEGLTVITGETGAGKSILLGALGLLLGQRGDAAYLLDKSSKCIVEGVFDVARYKLNDFFKANDLDEEPHCTIRREINPEGKSRAFINDTPVNLTLLKELTQQLLDVHSQHETLLLGNSRFQLNVVDACASNQKEWLAFKNAFQELSQLRRELSEAIEQQARSSGELDYLQFQFREINELQLAPGEQQSLEQEQQKLSGAEDILLQLNKACQSLRDGDENAVASLNVTQQTLSGLSRFDERFGQLHARIQSALIEVKDVYSEIEGMSEEFQADPVRLEKVNDRLSAIYSLQKKHRLPDLESLLRFKDELQEKTDALGGLGNTIAELEKKVQFTEKKTRKAAADLTASRTRVIPDIEKAINGQLKAVAMPHAVLRIALLEEKEGHYTTSGAERVQFLFSANKGGDFKEIGSVASGGELSRLMLCIKSLMAAHAALPTIIFDEIDTGISGETAARVGAILRTMAGQHQVIAITHLPQMAGKGNEHFLVFKETLKGHTRSGLRKLTKEERVSELARMLSGEQMTAAAMENAKALMVE